MQERTIGLAEHNRELRELHRILQKERLQYNKHIGELWSARLEKQQALNQALKLVEQMVLERHVLPVSVRKATFEMVDATVNNDPSRSIRVPVLADTGSVEVDLNLVTPMLIAGQITDEEAQKFHVIAWRDGNEVACQLEHGSSKKK